MTLHDLMALAEQACVYVRQHPPHECQAQLQGCCTLRLFREVSKPQGEAGFVTWCGPPQGARCYCIAR